MLGHILLALSGNSKIFDISLSLESLSSTVKQLCKRKLRDRFITFVEYFYIVITLSFPGLWRRRIKGF